MADVKMLKVVAEVKLTQVKGKEFEFARKVYDVGQELLSLATEHCVRELRISVDDTLFIIDVEG
ncbi:MAG: hypothetical protein OXH70_17510 [Acidobacteria bacterium]|nr:hypothetical protein [Acidobacteriota bacterium]